METVNKDQNTKKINYKEKNIEYLQKLKEKKVKQEEQKARLQKLYHQKRQSLRKKILNQAKQTRQNKKIQNQPSVQVLEVQKVKQAKHRSNVQSLPRINQSQNENQVQDKKKYMQRYLAFLQNLNQNIKSKKEKKKQDQYQKIKEELGINKVQSKLAQFIGKNHQLVRSHSAQKLKDHNDQEDLLPKTNKNFKKKNQEYIQKIKKKRQQQQQLKEEERLKKQKLKEKLKDFVMVTVKKNVLQGVYDDQIVERKKNNRNNYMKQAKEDTSQKKQLGQDSGDQELDDQIQQSEEVQKKKKRKLRSFPYITDIVEWRKKNRLQPDTKIYIITGGYNDLKKALKQRGWVQNPDYNSPCFNLKYTLQGKQINYDKLQDFQMVNHYQKNGCITTKIGLTKTLKNLIWINDTSQDNFFPKCFDLNDQDDYIGFQMNFKLCKALSIIKIYVGFVNRLKYGDQQSLKQIEKTKNNPNAITDLKLRAQVALCVCKKNIEDLNDIIDKKKFQKVVTDKEWQILSQDQLNEESLAKKKHDQWIKSIDIKYNMKGNPSSQKKIQKPKKQKKKKQQNKISEINQGKQLKQLSQQTDQLYQECKQILQSYQKKYPQYHLTGHNNIWILKPAGLSRGRGITCYNNLVEIQDHIKCKQSQWIAQKYIQNPLVVLKRKFDVRQWVLVTNFNPLTIWIYQQPYIRFSAIDYNAKQISNKFIHLTNNSIGAHHKQFQKSHIKGNMYFKSEFANYLQQLQGYDVYQEKIKPQIKDIVKLSLMCAAQNIENRKNNHELFGYDVMVDTNYKVWLIEINSSPSMDYSTHVTTKLVKQCLDDIAKVIVDYYSASKKDRKNIDTGKFKRIYKGCQVPDKPITSGLNLCLEGIPLTKPKKNFVKVQSVNFEKEENKN